MGDPAGSPTKKPRPRSSGSSTSISATAARPPRVSIPANPERDDDLLLHSYVAQQRRIEAALAQIIEIASPALDDLTSANQRENSIARTKIVDIVSRLGLADRVWGNPAKAEEAVS